MAVCEKCWADVGGDALAYAERIRQMSDAGQSCSPEEQCGERHTILPGCSECRCGVVRGEAPND